MFSQRTQTGQVFHEDMKTQDARAAERLHISNTDNIKYGFKC